MNYHQQSNQTKKVKLDKLEYLLNFEEKTASVVDCDELQTHIIIPTFISYESNEYIITSILSGVFRSSIIETLQFSPDSKIKTIESEAFLDSQIKSITIPASLTELKLGWCKYTFNLKKIDVSPENPIYKVYKDKYLIKKSLKESNNFDVLIFVCRDIKEKTIPKFIKCIDSFAYADCLGLNSIEIPSDSILETICPLAFSGSSIKSINFPASLIELKNGWCAGTRNLTNVQIDEKNTILTLYDNNFLLSKSTKEEENFDTLSFCIRDIKNATIPSFIKHIGAYAFNQCQKLETVDILPNSQLITIDEAAFLASSIKSFKCPSHVTFIGELAFHNCPNLSKIEIPVDSEIRIIEKRSFNYSAIESFTIPPHLTQICTNTFQSCKKLKKINFIDDSELKTIEKYAFQDSSIEIISIPSNLIEFKDEWSFDLPNVTSVEVSPKNPLYTVYENKFIIGKSSKEIHNFDVLVFCVRNIEKAIIPNFIKLIGSCAFEKCINLKTIEFSTDSELQTFGSYAFSKSLIERFTIPSDLTLIGKGSFRYCRKLRRIEVSENSKLQTIGKFAFSHTLIDCFSFPSHVKNIDEDIFYYCQNIQIIEFNENYGIELINQDMFKMCRKTILIMIPKKICDHLNLKNYY